MLYFLATSSGNFEIMTNGILDSGQKIITDGLVLNLDAAQLRSYPTTGTTWTDLSGNSNNGTPTGTN